MKPIKCPICGDYLNDDDYALCASCNTDLWDKAKSYGGGRLDIMQRYEAYLRERVGEVQFNEKQSQAN